MHFRSDTSDDITYSLLLNLFCENHQGMYPTVSYWFHTKADPSFSFVLKWLIKLQQDSIIAICITVFETNMVYDLYF